MYLQGPVSISRVTEACRISACVTSAVGCKIRSIFRCPVALQILPGQGRRPSLLFGRVQGRSPAKKIWLGTVPATQKVSVLCPVSQLSRSEQFMTAVWCRRGRCLGCVGMLLQVQPQPLRLLHRGHICDRHHTTAMRCYVGIAVPKHQLRTGRFTVWCPGGAL